MAIPCDDYVQATCPAFSSLVIPRILQSESMPSIRDGLPPYRPLMMAAEIPPGLVFAFIKASLFHRRQAE
jgi:hypothetical protein